MAAARDEIPLVDLREQERLYIEELRKGKRVPAWICWLVLGVTGQESYNQTREAYRRLARECCPRSGHYNESRYRLLKNAWDQLRRSRR
jgi:hypothetical protein